MTPKDVLTGFDRRFLDKIKEQDVKIYSIVKTICGRNLRYFHLQLNQDTKPHHIGWYSLKAGEPFNVSSDQNIMHILSELTLKLKKYYESNMKISISDETDELFKNPLFNPSEENMTDTIIHLNKQIQGYSVDEFMALMNPYALNGTSEVDLRIVGYNALRGEKFQSPELFVTTQEARPYIKTRLGGTISHISRSILNNPLCKPGSTHPNKRTLNNLIDFLDAVDKKSQEKGLQFTFKDETELFSLKGKEPFYLRECVNALLAYKR